LAGSAGARPCRRARGHCHRARRRLRLEFRAPGLRRNGTTVAAVAIFVGTYVVIAIGKLPGFRVDRAGAALIGASLMVAFGVIPLDEAYRAIDFETIMVANLIVAQRAQHNGIAISFWS
jgi:hypothetical protein